MDNNFEKIIFETEDGTEELYVIEETMLGGVNYLLLTDDILGEDGSFIILKETNNSEDDYTSYDIIEDDQELKSVIAIFNELVDDFDLEV